MVFSMVLFFNRVRLLKGFLLILAGGCSPFPIVGVEEARQTYVLDTMSELGISGRNLKKLYDRNSSSFQGYTSDLPKKPIKEYSDSIIIETQYGKDVSFYNDSDHLPKNKESGYFNEKKELLIDESEMSKNQEQGASQPRASKKLVIEEREMGSEVRWEDDFQAKGNNDKRSLWQILCCCCFQRTTVPDQEDLAYEAFRSYLTTLSSDKVNESLKRCHFLGLSVEMQIELNSSLFVSEQESFLRQYLARNKTLSLRIDRILGFEEKEKDKKKVACINVSLGNGAVESKKNNKASLNQSRSSQDCSLEFTNGSDAP